MKGCKFHNNLIEWKLYEEHLTSWYFYGAGRIGNWFTHMGTHFEMNYKVESTEFVKGDGFNLSNKKDFDYNLIFYV